MAETSSSRRRQDDDDINLVTAITCTKIHRKKRWVLLIGVTLVLETLGRQLSRVFQMQGSLWDEDNLTSQSLQDGIISSQVHALMTHYGDEGGDVFAFRSSTAYHEPAWPQKDSGIRDAIRIGHRIEIDQTPAINGTFYSWNNTECEAPAKGMATVVTAYYDLKSKHPREHYEKWIQNTVKATDPMIIFIDPDSEYHNWWPFIEKHRQHAPTLLVPLPFANLTMSRVFKNEFWDTYILPRDRSRHRKNGVEVKPIGVDVYKIWNEKIVLMREAALENPFDTEFFYWIDAGYFRMHQHAPKYAPIVRNNITKMGVKKHQLVYHMVNEFPQYEIAGGAWGGGVDAILLHYQKYWETFWYLTMYSDKECVGFEQRVLTGMCRSFPSLCVINYSRDWFAMGQTWLRDPQRDFGYRTIRIPEDSTTTVPLVDPSKVTLPTITKDHASTIKLIPEIPQGSRSLERQMNYSHVILREESMKRKRRKGK